MEDVGIPAVLTSDVWDWTSNGFKSGILVSLPTNEPNAIIINSSGGMLSATKEAVVEIEPSDQLMPITGAESRTSILPVLPGQIITLPGSIKALLREPDMPRHGGAPYKETATIL